MYNSPMCYLKFIHKNRYRQWYQPVVFTPYIEIKGKWSESTKDLSRKLFKNISGKSLLDVGCNTGFFLHEAYRHGATRIVGIDNDPEIFRLATEIAQLLEIPVELHNVEANLFDTSDTFDVVLMLNILEFLNDPQQCIKKYLKISDILILEHEKHHESYFPSAPNQTIHSDRAGNRIISVFGNTIDI